MCVKMRSSSGKEKRLMTQFFANAAASHFAQAACAAFSCSDMNSCSGRAEIAIQRRKN